MQQLQMVFVQGLQRALRLRLLLPLYLTGLLLGLIQTWPLLYAAADGMLNNPVLEDLAGGGSDALLNLMLGGSYNVAGAVTSWLFTTLLLTLVFSLAYNFFSGGILSVWTETRSFWAGCWHNVLSFTGLGLILVLLAALTLVFLALLGGLLGGTASLVIALLLLQVINLVGEYARAIGVVYNRCNPFVMFGMAVRFCIRNAGGVLALALLGLLLHGGLLLFYRGVLSGVDNLVVTIIGQQLLVLAWLWIKLLRLAWAASYAQSFVSPTDAARQTGQQTSTDVLTGRSSGGYVHYVLKKLFYKKLCKVLTHTKRAFILIPNIRIYARRSNQAGNQMQGGYACWRQYLLPYAVSRKFCNSVARRVTQSTTQPYVYLRRK